MDLRLNSAYYISIFGLTSVNVNPNPHGVENCVKPTVEMLPAYISILHVLHIVIFLYRRYV